MKRFPFLRYSTIAAASIAAFVMISGLANITIHHQIQLPTVYPHRIETQEFFNPSYNRLYSKKTDIRLETEIGSKFIDIAQKYADVNAVLQNAQEGDVVVIHLVGYGGDGMIMTDLINNIHQTKAHVKGIVEGTVYSAHAYIAAAIDDLTVLPNTFLMFHSGSLKGMDCDTKTDDYDPEGLDRGQPNKLHCHLFMDQMDKLDRSMVADVPFLTDEERQTILNGLDVYITADDFNSRTRNKDATNNK